MQFRTHAQVMEILRQTLTEVNGGMAVGDAYQPTDEVAELQKEYWYDEVVIDDAETFEEATSKARVIVAQRIVAAGNREAWMVMQKANWVEGDKGVRVQLLYRMVGNHD